MPEGRARKHSSVDSPAPQGSHQGPWALSRRPQMTPGSWQGQPGRPSQVDEGRAGKPGGRQVCTPSGPEDTQQWAVTKCHGHGAGDRGKDKARGAEGRTQHGWKMLASQGQAPALGKGFRGRRGPLPWLISSPGPGRPSRLPLLTRACSRPAQLFPSLI